MENLEEMDKLLETYKPKSESIHNMNRLITRNETESVIKSLPTKKVQEQLASLVNFTKHLGKS